MVKIKKSVLLSLVAILFFYWVVIAIRLAGNLYKGDLLSELIEFGGFVSSGVIVFLGVVIGKKIHKRWGINFYNLLKVLIIYAVISVPLSYINYKPFKNFYGQFCRYYLIDDNTEYDYIGSDGEEHYSSESTFRYFTSMTAKLTDLELPEGKVELNSVGYSLTIDDWENIPLNVDSVVFWQYAKNRGYVQLEDASYNEGRYFVNNLIVGPIYILELSLSRVGSCLLFLVLVILFEATKKDYFIDEKETKMSLWEKRISSSP